MGDKNKFKLIKFNKKVKHKDDNNAYSLQLRHRSCPWWLLLLLLPLLLFIRCEKDITVTCVDNESHETIEDMAVTMTYRSHFLWNDGKFFASTEYEATQQTDESGKTVFKDVPCSVFSYIFYCMSKESLDAKNNCYGAQDVKQNFHYTSEVEMEMAPLREDLRVQLRDKETGDVLPDGVLIYTYVELGEEYVDSAKADASGIATIPQMIYCSTMKEIKGVCYGYADTSKVDVPCQVLTTPNDSAVLKLRPIKERFTFFVKNKETKQPIPGAVCDVTLKHPGKSQTLVHRRVHTSIDGKGIAVYDNAFVLSTIAITANKIHYKQGVLEGGPWTVEKFIRQDDDTRTVWLEPDPYLQEFVNIDSITGRPIPGVKNEIIITDFDGTKRTVTEISNSNGVFPVTAKEDAKIEIISTKVNEYKDKKTRYPKFVDIKKQEKKIRMQPLMETLNFRTVTEEDKTVVLPGCNLQVHGSISGSLPPSNSGNGNFSVTFRKAELLSITASKKAYTTNSTKVRNRTWSYLKESQERRDIPLKMDLPPCSGGTNTPKGANEMLHQRSYGMGQMEGDASISGDFYSQEDYLTIYDGPDTSGKILVGPERVTANKFNIPFHFTKGAVTVVIKTHSDGSSWQYVVNCP